VRRELIRSHTTPHSRRKWLSINITVENAEEVPYISGTMCAHTFTIDSGAKQHN
jgi:hypothetical protein